MADGTRLFQLQESIKECTEGLAQQHTFNAVVEQKFNDLTELLQNVLQAQNAARVDRPPDDRERAHPPPMGPDNREVREERPEHREAWEERLVHRDAREERRDRREHREERWDQDNDFYGHPRDDRTIHTRAVRLEFPRFDGDNPSAWIYKVNQFFDYYRTPLYQRIRMASFHMEGEALIWFQDADEAGQFPTWDVFTQALLTRFGPAYDDPMESLVKLRHSTTVAAYTAQFESLSNRLRGLSDQYRLSCFLSGLKDEIRLPLRMLAPRTMVAAFGLAKLQEEYLNTGRKTFKSQSSSYNPSRSLSYGQQSASPSQLSDSSTSMFSPRSSPGVSVQRLSPAQMRERREKRDSVTTVRSGGIRLTSVSLLNSTCCMARNCFMRNRVMTL